MARMQTVAHQFLQRFIDTEDSTLLEKPIIFEKNDKWTNGRILGSAITFIGAPWVALLCPIVFWCPGEYLEYHDVKLDKDSVQISKATWNICWHVATNKTTIPLENIQDVKVQDSDDPYQSLFGVKQVNVQTTKAMGPVRVTADFLASPEQARQAIQTAVKLHKQHKMTAPGQAPGMQRGPAGSAPSGAHPAESSDLIQQLECMEQLMARGILSKGEFSNLMDAVLASEQDHTVEAADLVDEGLLSRQELSSRAAEDVVAAQAVTLNQPLSASRISIEKARV